MKPTLFTASCYFDGVQFHNHPVQIQIENGLITQIQKHTPNSEPVKKGILLPALVNAHAHLELTHLKGCLEQKQDFPKWVGQLRSITQNWTRQDFQNSFEAGLKECTRFGVGVVNDTLNQNLTFDPIQHPFIEYIPQIEIMGLNPMQASERLQYALQHPMSSLKNHQVALHAPFSCSQELMQLVHLKKQNYTQIHMAESRAENDLFVQNTGPMKDFLNFIYPEHDFGIYTEGAFEYFHSIKSQPKHLYIHNNIINLKQLYIIQSRNEAMVVCPQSRRFFGHPACPLTEALKLGICVGLGTDSLASAYTLNLWKDIDLLVKEEGISPETALKMATFNGALALELPFKGKIAIGAQGPFLFLEGVDTLSEAIELLGDKEDISVLHWVH